MTPFKAGETYRTRGDRAARIYADDGGKPHILHGAVFLVTSGWSPAWWQADGRMLTSGETHVHDLIPPAPTPPAADDLAAARAEIERLKARVVELEAALALETGNVLAPFLPSPPDAKPAPERERLKGWCWVNVHSYGHASASERRHLADEYAEEDARTYGPRIACIRVDLSQHFAGEGLEP